MLSWQHNLKNSSLVAVSIYTHTWLQIYSISMVERSSCCLSFTLSIKCSRVAKWVVSGIVETRRLPMRMVRDLIPRRRPMAVWSFLTARLFRMDESINRGPVSVRTHKIKLGLKRSRCWCLCQVSAGYNNTPSTHQNKNSQVKSVRGVADEKVWMNAWVCALSRLQLSRKSAI